MDGLHETAMHLLETEGLQASIDDGGGLMPVMGSLTPPRSRIEQVHEMLAARRLRTSKSLPALAPSPARSPALASPPRSPTSPKSPKSPKPLSKMMSTMDTNRYGEQYVSQKARQFTFGITFFDDETDEESERED